jgi:hypothetical protein
MTTLTALSSYTFPLSSNKYLYFQQHPCFVATFSTAILCFHRHSRVVPSLFEVLGVLLGGRAARAGGMLSILARGGEQRGRKLG